MKEAKFSSKPNTSTYHSGNEVKYSKPIQIENKQKQASNKKENKDHYPRK